MFEAPPEIIKWFKGLTDKQMVEFFYQAVKERSITGEGADYCREHLVVALATQMRDYISPNSTEYGPRESWETTFLSLHDRDKYEGEWDHTAPLCQYGKCVCGREVLCYAKEATCPVCGEPVYCT